MTADDIAKKLGRNPCNMRQTLKALREAGKIEARRVVVDGRPLWVYRDEG